VTFFYATVMAGLVPASSLREAPRPFTDNDTASLAGSRGQAR
jgi:hypothetical protein